jgi:GNAT superfamily N-acetyltransferase
MITLRDAHAADAPTLEALMLRSKAYWPYTQAQLDAFAPHMRLTGDDLTGPGCWGIVAVSADGAMAGFGVLAHIAEAEEAWWIAYLFVDPPHIGHGVGAAVYAALEQTARAHRAACLFVEADPNAADFYRRMGFEQVREQESPAIGGRVLPIMRKPLSGPAS